MPAYMNGGIAPPVAPPTRRDVLYMDDASVLGANAIDYASTADQSAKIQAICDYAGTATGGHKTIFQTGRILNCSGQIDVQRTGTVRWLGSNRDDTGASIRCPVDLGPGKALLRLGTSQREFQVENVCLLGPNAFDPIPIGGMPTKMMGIYIPTRGLVDRVTVKGFGAACGLINDHFKLKDVDFRGNTYGLDFMDNGTGGLGDIYIDGMCFFNDQSRASVAIASTNTGANFALTGNGHNGTAPFGWYRYQALNACVGASGTNVLTGVNVAYTPTAGMQINGPLNTAVVPAGTVIAPGGVSGSAGNWTLTLNNNLTGDLTQVELARRGTVLTGVVAQCWSHEYLGQCVFFDELAYHSDGTAAGDDGSWTDIQFQKPAEFGTGGSQDWEQINIAVGGRSGNTLTGVALTNFPPDRTLIAIGTGIPDVTGGGSKILGWSGTTGNYSLTLADTPSSTPATIIVGKPKKLANMEVGDIGYVTWTEQGPSIQSDAPDQPYMRAKSIKGIRATSQTVMGVGPVGHKSFQIRARSRGGAEVTDVLFGTPGARFSGGNLICARMCDEAIARGDLLDANGTNNRLRKCRPGCYPVGFSMGTYSQYDVVFYAPGGNDFRILGHNTSGVQLGQGALVKPDQTANSANWGGVIAATSLTDGPIVGFVNDAPIAAGATGRIAPLLG